MNITHPHAAVFVDDIDITVAWGLNPSATDDDNDWGYTEAFTQRDAHEEYADFFYRGALVHREKLLFVDGRTRLPIAGQRLIGDDDDDAVVEYFTTEQSRKVARLVHSFHGYTDFDEMFQRAGIIIEG
ncbi:hypothetical protein EU244_033830 [Rhodococcus qingshengii]|uniref:hypothetical protein n=1 Tax=Rhodococcus qingshengii TaxID=334542 RepID=UPI0010A69CE0|nr:hypothetical protein [Rhodococcus qingshengii]THJ69490.1 hypothetical protein EU244_21260 [Rhodococcus qingshengii]